MAGLESTPELAYDGAIPQEGRIGAPWFRATRLCLRTFAFPRPRAVRH